MGSMVANSNCVEIQKQITRARPEMPIHCDFGLCRYSDNDTSDHGRVIEFLVKPRSNDLLLGAIRQGLERSRMALYREMEMDNQRSRYSLLTPRERSILDMSARDPSQTHNPLISIDQSSLLAICDALKHA